MEPQTSRRLPWRRVLLLGATALAWPVVGLAGGGPAPVLVLFGALAVVWVTVLALPTTSRPVLTGVLAAVLHALVLTTVGLVAGDAMGPGPGPSPVGLVLGAELVPAVLLGAGAGLLGQGLRSVRGRRP